MALQKQTLTRHNRASEGGALPRGSLGAQLFSAGVALMLLALSAGGLTVWDSEGSVKLSELLLGVCGGLLVVGGIVTNQIQGSRSFLAPEGFLVVSALSWLTDWHTRPYSFIDPTWNRPLLLWATIVALALIITQRTERLRWFGLGTLGVCLITFLVHLNGRLLFSDDHATFLYRLLLLGDNFPSIPFFNTHWNAGIDQRDFFATGTLNVLFFAWPLLWLTDLTTTYSLFVGCVLFGIVPAGSWLAARLSGFSRFATSATVVLSVASGLVWYRWVLLYGTMGFAISTALIPLNMVLAARIIDRRASLSPLLVVGSALSLSLMLCWSLSGIVFLPLLLLAATRLRSLYCKPLLPTLAGLLLAINLPWIALFWQVSNVGSFLKSEKISPAQTRESFSATESGDLFNNSLIATAPSKPPPPLHVKSEPRGFSLEKSLKIWREFAASTNPLIILLWIPAAFALPRSLQLPYLFTSSWLLALGIGYSPAKPQLELDRMLVIWSQLSALPLGAFFGRVATLSSGRGSLLRIGGGAVALGALLLSPFATTTVLQHRTLVPYHVKQPWVDEMTAAIKALPGDGRVLFSGFLLHEISGGHAAPFPYWTGKELLALSHVHNAWRYRDFIPAEVLAGGEATVAPFLDLFAVSAVFAHEAKWRDYFNSHPESYRPVWGNRVFTLYQRIASTPSFFLSGSGAIAARTGNELTVTVEGTEAVLKYRYLPFLTIEGGCSLSGHPTGISPDPGVPQESEGELLYLRLSNCSPGATVKIRSVSPFSRLFIE